MANYKELKQKIEELEKQAEDVRKQEIANAIDEIKAKMTEYGITGADLVLSTKTRRKAIRSFIGKPIPSVDISNIAQAVRSMGMKLYPTTQKYLEETSAKAKLMYPELSEQDIYHCSVALVSVGIEEAHKAGSVVVRIKHVKAGWDQRLSLAPGNCPPYRCSKRAIVDRLEEVQEQIPTFRKITGNLER